MAMVCPKCNGSFEQSLHCPSCGVRLLYESKGFHGEGAHGHSAGQWLHSPVGRIAAGILLAQGLAYSLQLLCNAYMQAAVVEAHQTVWSTLYGLVLLQSIQGLSLLCGGALAGASQRRAPVLGAVVGSVHGTVFLILQRLHGEHPAEMTLYGQPVLHVAFGVVGAIIGAGIWQPLPALAMSDFDTEKQERSTHRRSLTLAALSGPVAWGRVSAGMVIVTAGFLWGPNLLALVLETGQGTLRITDRLQAQLVTWEIIGLATLLGAAIAGATTRNGLKQGLVVGLGASILLIGNHLGGKNIVVDQLIYTTGGIVALTIAGGWFGGQLFPPVQAYPRRGAGSAY
jgi:hypothetical protein